MELKPPITYKGVDIFSTQNVHDKSKGSRKIHLFFDLNGTHYRNAAVMEYGTNPEDDKKAMAELLDWAKTVINENQS